MPTDKETDWIYRESTKKLLMRLLLAGCAISVLLEFVLGGRKGKFDVDGIPGFYALLGFVSCTLMIFAAKGLGLWLKVPTNFYEKEKTDDNNQPPKKNTAKKVAKKSTKKKIAKKATRKVTKKREGGSR
jgi:hypothetical protein